MTRGQIQAVIDEARDNDTIRFAAGDLCHPSSKDFTNLIIGLELKGETSSYGAFPLIKADVVNNRIAAWRGICAGNGECRKNKYAKNKIIQNNQRAKSIALFL